MRLQYMIDIELSPAALRRGRRSPLSPPLLKYCILYFEAELPCRHIKANHVAGFRQRQRTTDCRFRRDMQNHRAVGCAAHACVRNADHVLHSPAQQLWWQRHVSHFRHTGITAGPAVLENHDTVFVDIQTVVDHSRVKIFDVLKYNRSPSMAQQMLTRSRRFDHCSIRSEVASHYRNARMLLEWLGKG